MALLDGSIQPGRRQFMLAIGAILVVGFALRMALRSLDGTKSFWQNSYYFFFELARSVATGRGYAFSDGSLTAFRVPFYPLFLAIITQGQKDFWSLLIAQSAVSSGTVACAGALAWHFFDRRTALVTAAMTAFYPYYAWHDTSLQETGLLTFLTALSVLLLFLARKRGSLLLAAATGLVLGVDVLTRSVVLPFACFAVFWLLLKGPAVQALSRRIGMAGLCLLLLCASLVPWLVRNHNLTGSWTLSTELGAAVFYGNNPKTFSFYPEKSIDLSAQASREAFTPAERAELQSFGNGEVATEQWFLHRGLAYIKDDPTTFLLNAVRKNLAGFGVFPSPRHNWQADLVQGASYCFVLVMGLVGLWQTRRRWREIMPIYALFISFAGITGIIWAHSSHRAFLDVYLIVFAAHTLSRGFNLLRPVSPNRNDHEAPHSALSGEYNVTTTRK